MIEKAIEKKKLLLNTAMGIDLERGRVQIYFKDSILKIYIVVTACENAKPAEQASERASSERAH